MSDDRPHIIFTDDEPLILSALRRQLHRHSAAWRMSFTQSASESIRMLESESAAVLVTDLTMPGMNGLELAARAQIVSPDTVVLMLTGTADLTTAITALNKGNIYRFFTKPCDSEELLDGIHSALAHRKKRSDGQAEQGLAALNALAIGVIVTSPEGLIRFMNRAAARIIDRKDGLLVDVAGRLCCNQSSETVRLRRAISEAAEDPSSRPDGISVGRPSMARSLNVMTLPLTEAPQKARSAGEALVFISDPDAGVVPDISILRSLLGLSEAEARIAGALAEGRKLDEAAVVSGVTLSTARTYLKQIFQKTGVGRQSELVKLILTSPALMIENKPVSGDSEDG